MSGLDAWLERPYVKAAAEADAFFDWCEREDVDPDSPEAGRLYDEAVEAAKDYYNDC